MNNYLRLMEEASEYVAAERPQLNEPSLVARFVRPLIASAKQETLVVIFLDSRNQAIDYTIAALGTANKCPTHPRDVFREAITRNAAKIVLSHNHPSGNPKPSADDISLTKTLQMAGEIIGIEIIDHVVVGSRSEHSTGYESLRENGLLIPAEIN